MFEQMRIDFLNGTIDTQCKLMEKRLSEAQTHAIDLAELLRGIMCFLITKFCDLPQAFLAKKREIDRRPECDQPLVGADVRGSAFTFDVLFSGVQCKDVDALPAIIHCFSDQTSRHSMHEVLARSEKANAGSAIPHRDSQWLTIAHNHVRAHRARRLEHSKCSWIRNNTDQCTFRVRGIDELGVIVDTSEEIRVLHNDERCIVVDQTC